jgi:S1-C subfamily serine protease
MQKHTKTRLGAMALAAIALAVLCLFEFEVVEQISYAMEKGRLRALRETIPVAEPLTEAQRIRRTVAELVTAGVVSLETEYPALMMSESAHESDRSASDETPGRNQGTGQPEEAIDSTDSNQHPDYAISIRQGLGSGFVFDAEHGYILTNAHVVDGTVRIQVRLPDGRQAEAEPLGSDPQSDLAVIRVDLGRLHELPFGDSEAVRVGDDVFAVGNPFGLEGTVTRGIISAVGRRNILIAGSVYGSLLQTDAVITQGNSGGPLVNMRGEVIGISTAMATVGGEYDGVGFAIPSARAGALVGELIVGGPGILGVMVGSVSMPFWQTPAAQLGWTEGYGALVTEVMPGMAAERAGIKRDDIIIAVDDARIDTSGQLADLIEKTTPGVLVELRIWRSGERLTVPVRVGRRFAPRRVTQRS